MTESNGAETDTVRNEVDRIASLYDKAERGRDTLIAVSAMLKILVDHAPNALKVARDYRKCLIDYESGEAWTLDAAFNVDGHRKGKNRIYYKFRRKYGLQIYRDVVGEAYESSIDEAFITVGEKYNRSAESIREIYYDIRKIVNQSGDDLLKKMNLTWTRLLPAARPCFK